MSEPTWAVRISNLSGVGIKVNQREINDKEAITFSLQQPLVQVKADAAGLITITLQGNEDDTPIEQSEMCMCIANGTSVGLWLNGLINLTLRSAISASAPGRSGLGGLRCGEGEPPPTA